MCVKYKFRFALLQDSVSIKIFSSKETIKYKSERRIFANLYEYDFWEIWNKLSIQ